MDCDDYNKIKAALEDYKAELERYKTAIIKAQYINKCCPICGSRYGLSGSCNNAYCVKAELEHLAKGKSI